MSFTKTTLKALFRQKVKVVAGGPTTKTRGVGMHEVLDALTDTAVLTINGATPDEDGDVALPAPTFADLTGEVADNAKLVAAFAGKADLVNGLVPANQLPSYVDDVLEFAQLSAFPTTGEAGKIYVAANSGKTYRWAGSGYALLSDSGLTADQLAGLTGIGLSAADKAATLSKLTWQYLGNPDNNNRLLGPTAGWLSGNTLNSDTIGNEFFDPIAGGISLAAGCYFNKVREGTNTVTLAANCKYNDVGPFSETIKFGTGCVDNRTSYYNRSITFGNSCQGCRVGPNVQNVTFGNGCRRVVVAGTAPQAFTVLANTKDAFYLDGVLVPAGTGTPPDYDTVKASIYGRFNIGGFVANTPIKKGDEIIRPDGLARVAAKADFTTGSNYVTADWTVTDAVLSLAQAQQLDTLTARAANIFLRFANGTSAGYATFDEALAAAGLNGGAISADFNTGAATISQNNRGNWPAFVDAGGCTITVPDGVTLTSNAAGINSFLFANFFINGPGANGAGTGIFELAGQLAANTPVGRASLLHNGQCYLTLHSDSSVVALANGYYKKLTGNTTYYLLGTVQVDDYSQAPNVIDRRPGTSSGSGTLATGTYPAPAAGAQTIPQAGATGFFDVGKRATNGQVYALSNGTGYTTQAGQLNILAAANVQAGEVIEYAYLTGSAPVSPINGAEEIQISTDATYKVARIKLTQARQLADITAYASMNASGYKAQVNAYRAGAWVAGLVRTSVNDLNADITALSASDYQNGAELELEPTPLTTGPAGLLLHIANTPAVVSFLSANRTARRSGGGPAYSIQETDAAVRYNGGAFEDFATEIAYGGSIKFTTAAGAYYEVTVPSGYSQVTFEGYTSEYGATFSAQLNGNPVGNGTQNTGSNGPRERRTYYSFQNVNAGDVVRLVNTGGGLYADQITFLP